MLLRHTLAQGVCHCAIHLQKALVCPADGMLYYHHTFIVKIYCQDFEGQAWPSGWFARGFVCLAAASAVSA